MTRVVFNLPVNKGQKGGTYGSTVSSFTLIWDDELPCQSIISALNTGSYQLPVMLEPAGVFAVEQSGLIVVSRTNGSKKDPVHLTKRQREVLAMLAEGKALVQIGYLLGLKPRTITGHISNLKEVFVAGSREQLVARAVAMGLYQPSLPG